MHLINEIWVNYLFRIKIDRNRQVPSMYLDERKNLKNNGKIIQVNNVHQYRSSTSPLIAKEAHKLIEDKLQIEKKSLNGFRNREQKGNMYINYKKNPFRNFGTSPHRFSNIQNYTNGYQIPTTPKKKNQQKEQHKKYVIPVKISQQQHPHSHREASGQTSKDQNQQIKLPQTIVEELNRLKTQPPTERYVNLQKERREIQETMLLASTTTRRILSKIERVKINYQNDRRQMIKSQKDKEKLFETRLTIMEQTKKYSTVNIEDIVKIPQKSFIFQREKRLNIFRLDERGNETLHEALKNCNFDFNRIIDKVPKIKIPIGKDLTRLGRRLITDLNVPITTVLSYMDMGIQQEASKNSIRCDTLMMLANGVVSPNYLADNKQAFRKKKDKKKSGNGSISGSQDESSNSSQQVPCPKNHQNYMMDFRGFREEKFEVQDYKRSTMLPDQRQCLQLSQNFKQRIEALLDYREQTNKYNIKDKKSLESYSTQMENSFSNFWLSGKSKIIGDDDMDKVVRLNKVSKTKSETIRYQNFIQTLESKKKMDKKMQKLQTNLKNTSARKRFQKVDEELEQDKSYAKQNDEDDATNNFDDSSLDMALNILTR